jgi:hypothetical protein
MKPYLAQYLRSRDLEGFRAILEKFVSPLRGDTRRVVLRSIELMLPAAGRQFPSLSESEMLQMAIERVADLDIPAEL